MKSVFSSRNKCRSEEITANTIDCSDYLLVLSYGSEVWTICKSDRTRITANEIKFLRRTAGYTKLDKKRSMEILW
jgi:hypothetical protein